MCEGRKGSIGRLCGAIQRFEGDLDPIEYHAQKKKIPDDFVESGGVVCALGLESLGSLNEGISGDVRLAEVHAS